MSLLPISSCCGVSLIVKIGTEILVCVQCETEYQLLKMDKLFKTVIAKYPGNCLVCFGVLSVGEYVLWKKGTGVKHLLCKRNPESTKNFEAWLK